MGGFIWSIDDAVETPPVLGAVCGPIGPGSTPDPGGRTHTDNVHAGRASSAVDQHRPALRMARSDWRFTRGVVDRQLDFQIRRNTEPQRSVEQPSRPHAVTAPSIRDTAPASEADANPRPRSATRKSCGLSSRKTIDTQTASKQNTYRRLRNPADPTSRRPIPNRDERSDRGRRTDRGQRSDRGRSHD
jgi:hypothetical protein